MAYDISKLGVDRSKLKSEFEGTVPGRHLLLDLDGACYRAASTSARLDTAIRKLQSEVLTQMFLTQSEQCTAHLTSKDCRKNKRSSILSAKPYQANRDGKSKPTLTEPLRAAMAHPMNWVDGFEVVFNRDVEADDAIITQAHQLQELGVVWSDDKDLRCTPYPWFDKETGKVLFLTDPHGWVDEAFTQAGSRKLIGHGPAFFWAQMLMGDQADNVQGLGKLFGKQCGPAAALEYLRKHRPEDYPDAVVDAYRHSGQNIIAEAWQLHLLRNPIETAYDYLLSCKLSAPNTAFIRACAGQQWFLRHNERRDYAKGKWTSEVYTV